MSTNAKLSLVTFSLSAELNYVEPRWLINA